MLCLRRNEKLLDALLSLAEIFRLVSDCEHVPYALLILPTGALQRSGNGCMRQHSHLVLSVLALSFDCRQMYQKASCTVYFSSAGLTDSTPIFLRFLSSVVHKSPQDPQARSNCHKLFTRTLKIKRADLCGRTN